MRSSPSSPLAAISTRYPSSDKRVSSDSRIAASSSMISIRCPVSIWAGGEMEEMASVASDMRRFPQHGKFEIEGGSSAEMTFHVNLSGVLLDDAVSNR